MLPYYFLLAFKGLRRTPWLAALMVCTLAVGLAAGMVTVTLRHAMALDPIPGKSARLLNLQAPAVQAYSGRLFRYADAEALERLGSQYATAVISGLGIAPVSTIDRRAIDHYVFVRYATRGFFRVFDVPLKHGRIWTHAEAESAAPVALLSYGMAKSLFPDGHAVGGEVRLGKTLFTVIGVTFPWNPRPRYYDLDSPAGAFGGEGDGMFVPVTAVRYAPFDMLVPRWCATGQLIGAPQVSLLSSDCGWLSVWYLAHSQKDVAALSRRLVGQLASILPKHSADRMRLLSVAQMLSRADLVPGSVRLYTLLGLAFLALCVVNASGMQLSRALRGTSQIGIRRALGASRLEIVQQYLCDASLVGGAGGLLGIALTFGGLFAFRRIAQGRLPYAQMAYMDKFMFVWMIVLIIVCSLLVGVIPAWIASRANPALVIKVAQ